jgi:tetratricopeptide (TPR) repeat protein
MQKRMTRLPSLLQTVGGPLVICLLVLAVYANSFPGAFIQDDHLIVQKNPLVKEFRVREILTTGYWHGAANNGLYRPLPLLSFAVDQRLFGNEPWGYHLVNVFLHAVVSILTGSLFVRWGAPPFAAWLGAAIFAVHPIHAEVVNLAVGRSELLAALCMLAGLLLVRHRGWAGNLGVGVCFLCALLSKEHAITFLAILPVAELFASRSVNVLKQRWPLYAGLVAVAAVWLVWRAFGVDNPLALGVPSKVAVYLAYEPPLSRMLTACELQWLYLSKLILPFGLQGAYDRSDLPAVVASIFTPVGILVIIGFLLLGAAVVAGWRKGANWARDAALYAMAFAPTANLLFPIGVTFAERLTYWPSVWYCSTLAFALGGASDKRRRWWLLSAGAYVLLLAVLGVARNPDFASEQKYWAADLKKNPADVLSLTNQAAVQLSSGDHPGADTTIGKVLAIEPDFPYVLQLRARSLIAQGKYREAMAPTLRGLELAESRNDRTSMGYLMQDMTDIHAGLGDYVTASAWMERSDRMLNNQQALVEQRGNVLAGVGRDAEAFEVFTRLAEQEKSGDGRYRFAVALARVGRLSVARAQLEMIPADTRNAAAWNLLGVILQQLGEHRAAETAMSNAVRLAPDNPYYRENLDRVKSGR